jgi:DNA gyrase/topoisomerase IV subunit A
MAEICGTRTSWDEPYITSYDQGNRLAKGHHAPSSSASLGFSSRGLEDSLYCRPYQRTPIVAMTMSKVTMAGIGLDRPCTNALPTRARMKRVRKSPRQAASGEAILSVCIRTTDNQLMVTDGRRVLKRFDLPGLRPNHRQTTTSQLMKLPNTAELRLAVNIPVLRINMSCLAPGLVYPSVISSLPGIGVGEAIRCFMA